jgi:hypothetical protein
MGWLSPYNLQNWIAYDLDVPEAGEYSLHIGVKKQDQRGIYQVSVDGVDIGEPQDTYAPGDTYEELHLGNITVDEPGTIEVRLTHVGRNPASIDSSLALDYFKLDVPGDDPGPGPDPCPDTTPRHEAHCLEVATSPGASQRVFEDANMSAGLGHLFTPNTAGAWVNYTVAGLAPGTYDLRAGVKKQDTRGIYQLAVGGTDVGEPEDLYAPSDTYPEIDYGQIVVDDEGEVTFRFTHVGRNPDSAGSTLSLDFFRLASVPDD